MATFIRDHYVIIVASATYGNNDVWLLKDSKLNHYNRALLI